MDKRRKGKANEKRKMRKVKKSKDEEVNGQGEKKWGRGAPAPYRAHNVAGAEAYLHAMFHLDPSIHLATIHQRQRQDRHTTVR